MVIVASFSVFPSFLSPFLVSYTQCISHLCPSLLSIPSRHLHELGLVVPSGNGCPTYMHSCESNTRICVSL